ncbi:MAG: mechanosensitive ion channel family protein [Duncaniella sp.]|nr:mechanosensitive ion channel family protein [Duncaniella sp.]
MLCDIIPTHTVAVWLLESIYKILDWFGLRHDKTTEEIIYVAVIVLLALAIGWLLKLAIVWLVRKIIAVKRPNTAALLTQYHVFTRTSRVIPPLVILTLLPFAFTKTSTLLDIAERLVWCYTIIVFTIAVTSIVTMVWVGYNNKRNTRNLPLNGVLNTIVGVLWIITAIVVVSVLINKSPAMLLTGLGAFAAALMLVFKDSILGFVAGIQLSQNDMLRVGDWIVVPSTIANGIVIDVSLSAVKVQNWDNTIVTLPPYTLISTSFQNWRGMTQSGCRQIARSILVDTNSITPVSDETTDQLVTRYPLLKPWVDKTRAAGHNTFDPGLATVNGSLETNLGLLRAYLCAYLLDSAAIDHNQQILVRTMAPTAQGIPLQIWAFTATTAWTAYEAIQSALFEHIVAIAPDFGLEIYNEESGKDAVSPVSVSMLNAASGTSSTDTSSTTSTPSAKQ